MANPNIVNDLSVVTRVPNKILEQLVEKTELCIGSAIHDALKAGETATVLNIGIGTLSVDLVDMQCKFIPSKELRAVIKKSLTDNVDPLELVLEDALVQKLINIYDEVL